MNEPAIQNFMWGLAFSLQPRFRAVRCAGQRPDAGQKPGGSLKGRPHDNLLLAALSAAAPGLGLHLLARPSPES